MSSDFGLPPWLVSAIILLIALAAGLLAHGAVTAVIREVLTRHPAPVLRPLLHRLDAPARAVFMPAAALAALPSASLSPRIEDSVVRVLGVWLVAALGWTLVRATDAIFDAYLHRGQPDTADIDVRRRRTRLAVFRQFAMAGIVLVTMGLVLTAIPAVRNIGLSLFASAGVAGLVVGMAARPAVANFIAGLQIAMTQPIRIGDAVLVEGEFGFIEDIGAAFVVLRTWDQRRMVVPLAYFLEKPFQNWTRQAPELLGEVKIHTDYAVPVDAVRARVHEILKSSPLWDGRVWGLQVSDLKERSVELRALVSARNAGDAWDLRCHVREQLLKFLREECPDCLPRVHVAFDRETGAFAGRAAEGCRAA
ncbi:MAG TPA: mechanosensitive ion channel domain-containing protein [Azospirillaceae bacterium]|nr:mechanosensitive ion channel domain-containing protein [Azospirillaceae bacterium]